MFWPLTLQRLLQQYVWKNGIRTFNMVSSSKSSHFHLLWNLSYLFVCLFVYFASKSLKLSHTETQRGNRIFPRKCLTRFILGTIGAHLQPSVIACQQHAKKNLNPTTRNSTVPSVYFKWLILRTHKIQLDPKRLSATCLRCENFD